MVQDNLEFTPLVPNVDLKGTVFVPTRSSTMVECFAIDWLICNLKLERVGMFTCPSLVSPLVQLNAYIDDESAALTTAVELFANKGRDLFAIQIRSEILRKKQFATQIANFLSSLFEKIIVVSGSDSCYLSGEELEKPQISWDCDYVVNGGIAQYLCRELSGKKLVVASTRGKGIGEIILVAKDMAKACAGEVGVCPETIAVPPPSVRLVV